MTAKKILLVDDEQPLRHSLAEQLELHDEFVTTQSGDGSAALELAKGQHFDLILLDVGLGELDGREVCKMMRKGGVKCPSSC